MKQRPILFSPSMVRALLDGSKTQTRRIVKPHRSDDAFCLQDFNDGAGWWPYRSEDGESPFIDGNEFPLSCPFGSVSDQLWVRETHRPIFGQTCGLIGVDYLADPRDQWARLGDEIGMPIKWTPSIHMRREYSRITLEIISIRVERLNVITDADSQAEGIYPTATGLFTGSAIAAYKKLWEQINGAGSWDANPWVWVIEFKRVQK